VLLVRRVNLRERARLNKESSRRSPAALAAIFNDSSMKFEIEMGNIGGRPAADWRVCELLRCAGKSPETRISWVNAYHCPPLRRRMPRRGVTDVVSLALRLALLELSRPRPGGPMLFDEPGKMISRDITTERGRVFKRNTPRENRPANYHGYPS